ncbi:hypothetical protein Tco_1514765 [Tanacetum coccineum]
MIFQLHNRSEDKIRLPLGFFPSAVAGDSNSPVVVAVTGDSNSPVVISGATDPSTGYFLDSPLFCFTLPPLDFAPPQPPPPPPPPTTLL